MFSRVSPSTFIAAKTALGMASMPSSSKAERNRVCSSLVQMSLFWFVLWSSRDNAPESSSEESASLPCFFLRFCCCLGEEEERCLLLFWLRDLDFLVFLLEDFLSFFFSANLWGLLGAPEGDRDPWELRRGDLGGGGEGVPLFTSEAVSFEKSEKLVLTLGGGGGCAETRA